MPRARVAPNISNQAQSLQVEAPPGRATQVLAVAAISKTGAPLLRHLALIRREPQVLSQEEAHQIARARRAVARLNLVQVPSKQIREETREANKLAARRMGGALSLRALRPALQEMSTPSKPAGRIPAIVVDLQLQAAKEQIHRSRLDKPHLMQALRLLLIVHQMVAAPPHSQVETHNKRMDS